MDEWISKDRLCLYRHTSPSGKVYVGITNNTKNRWRSGGIGYRSQTAFWNAIKKYGWENFKHEILKTNLTVDEAKQMEIDLIANLKSNNHKYGYNITSGGDRSTEQLHTPEAVAKAMATKKAKLEAGIHTARYGTKYSPELRKKLSDAHIGLQLGPKHGMYGKKLTDEQKQHLREINTGKKYSEESKIKRSESGKGKHSGERHAMYGKNLPDKTRSKISESLRNNSSYTTRQLTILQCNLDGEVLRKWNSLTEIKKELHLDAKGVSDCCKLKRKTYLGYIWRYEHPELSTRNPQLEIPLPSWDNTQ